MNHFVSIILTGIFLASELANSCPVYLPRSDLKTTAKLGFKDLFLVVQNPQQRWQQQALQANSFDRDGNFVFGKQKPVVLNQNDVILFREEFFGPKTDDFRGLHCIGGIGFELVSQDSNFGYLMHCPRGLTFRGDFTPIDKHKVKYNKTLFQISSTQYDYNFVENNYMMFRDIIIKDPLPNNSPLVAARDSNIFIYSDLKNFFSLKFDNEDIASYLNDYEFRDLGIVGNVNFYLDLLLFKLKLSLLTDVSFYDDSVHIPMRVFVPYDSKDYLNEGSGILYTWEPNLLEKLDATEVMHLDQYLAPKKDIQHLLTKNCSGKPQKCSYFLGFTAENHRFTMQFSLQRELIDKKFYPVWIENLEAFQKKLDWPKLKIAHLEKKVGLFFDTTHLAKGTSEWDFWMQMSKSSQTHEGLCPKSVRVSRTILLP